jgi:hypothetical protein
VPLRSTSPATSCLRYSAKIRASGKHELLKGLILQGRGINGREQVHWYCMTDQCPFPFLSFLPPNCAFYYVVWRCYMYGPCSGYYGASRSCLTVIERIKGTFPSLRSQFQPPTRDNLHSYPKEF